jgi:hypothetical protein
VINQVTMPPVWLIDDDIADVGGTGVNDVNADLNMVIASWRRG